MSCTPFAYNTGSTLSGTSQICDLAIGGPTVECGSNYGGLKWWAGPDDTLGYIIANARPAGQPVPGCVTEPQAYVGFWRSKLLTEQSFLDLANYIAGKNNQPPFTNANEAVIWLNANCYYTNFVPTTPTPTPTINLTSTPTLTQTITPTQTITQSVTPTFTSSPTQTPTLTQTQTPTVVCNDCRNWNYVSGNIPIGGDVIHYYSCVDGSPQSIALSYGDPDGNFCNCNSILNPPYTDNGTILTEIGICPTPTPTPTYTPTPTNNNT